MHSFAITSLIIASLIFYVYDSFYYGGILILSILINYSLSYAINRLSNIKVKKWILLCGILLNITSIFYFKYFDFVMSNICHVLKYEYEAKNIVLPLGISFFTFQQISYLVDTYRGETKDYKFMEYVAFVSFFPQLVAGPIVLHNEFIPQLRNKEKKKFNNDLFAQGTYMFTIGLFKKVLIADTFNNAVTYGWNNIDTLTSAEIFIVMLSYTMQRYFDFSGYCDMAIGIGKMFNIELPINFNSPYKAYSVTDFWNRWHMSLTRFLRKYVYFPLGGGRKGTTRTYINIIIVFLLSGIWHGANWTFICWGIIHGIANVLNRIFAKRWNSLHMGFQWCATFLFINLTWLIFRSEDMTQALELIKRLLEFKSLSISEGLSQCFMFEDELQFILKLPYNDVSSPVYILQNRIWNSYQSCVYMVVFFTICIIGCLASNNLHTVKFKPTIQKAVLTVVLLFWCIISLSGVSTFLYFNF